MKKQTKKMGNLSVTEETGKMIKDTPWKRHPERLVS